MIERSGISRLARVGEEGDLGFLLARSDQNDSILVQFYFDREEVYFNQYDFWLVSGFWLKVMSFDQETYALNRNCSSG